MGSRGILHKNITCSQPHSHFLMLLLAQERRDALDLNTPLLSSGTPEAKEAQGACKRIEDVFPCGQGSFSSMKAKEDQGDGRHFLASQSAESDQICSCAVSGACRLDTGAIVLFSLRLVDLCRFCSSWSSKPSGGWLSSSSCYCSFFSCTSASSRRLSTWKRRIGGSEGPRTTS
jgi:hypothetical protein